MTEEPTTGAFAKRRSIRSFIIREGRLTRGQARALESGWPRFGLEYKAAQRQCAADKGGEKDPGETDPPDNGGQHAIGLFIADQR